MRSHQKAHFFVVQKCEAVVSKVLKAVFKENFNLSLFRKMNRFWDIKIDKDNIKSFLLDELLHLLVNYLFLCTSQVGKLIALAVYCSSGGRIWTRWRS